MAGYRKIEAHVVRAAAAGKWLNIIQAICPGMFDEAIRNLGEHVDCPLHGGEGDFRFVKVAKKGYRNTAEVGVAMCTCGPFTDGFSLLMRATGLSFFEVLKEVDAYLTGGVSMPASVSMPVFKERTPAEIAEEEATILEKSKNLWNAGKPLNLTAFPYYKERGISESTLADIQNVRTLNSLGYFHKTNGQLEKLGSYPALLALMTNADNQLRAVHRTWLSEDKTKKAPVPKAKKLGMSPDVRGSAIRLFNADNATTLGLTEGIETALAVRELSMKGYWGTVPYKVPVWATFAERNIRNFQIPKNLLPTLRRLIVFADNDESGTGLTAANVLKERLAKENPTLEVSILMPNVQGWDWLDVLANQ